MPRGAERPRDAMLCRGTARRYNVQINRAIPETVRHYVVQRDHAMLQLAEKPCCVHAGATPFPIGRRMDRMTR